MTASTGGWKPPELSGWKPDPQSWASAPYLDADRPNRDIELGFADDHDVCSAGILAGETPLAGPALTPARRTKPKIPLPSAAALLVRVGERRCVSGSFAGTRRINRSKGASQMSDSFVRERPIRARGLRQSAVGRGAPGPLDAWAQRPGCVEPVQDRSASDQGAGAHNASGRPIKK